MAKGCLAQPRCFLQDHLEHWCEVTRRRIDDLQYLSGCSLLLQRFARLSQQPRVLHRDDRLRGEVLQKCDLPVAEWSDLLAVNDDRAMQCAILAQRHRDKCPDTGEVRDGTTVRIT